MKDYNPIGLSFQKMVNLVRERGRKGKRQRPRSQMSPIGKPFQCQMKSRVKKAFLTECAAHEALETPALKWHQKVRMKKRILPQSWAQNF